MVKEKLLSDREFVQFPHCAVKITEFYCYMVHNVVFTEIYSHAFLAKIS